MQTFLKLLTTENSSQWSNILVGYNVGVKLFYSQVERIDRPNVEPYIRLKFSCEKRAFSSNQEHRSTIRSCQSDLSCLMRLIILKRCEETINLERDLLFSILIWIRFTNFYTILGQRSFEQASVSLQKTHFSLIKQQQQMRSFPLQGALS